MPGHRLLLALVLLGMLVAPAVGDEQPDATSREHWAFQPPVRPDVPDPENADWVRNPIDAFLAARLEEHGLTPVPEATRNVLLRRVYLDLIGLPPTPDELRAFLENDSPTAYEKVVDRLLASPQYGERWGRHWMDVWRYSDWYGYRKELRNSARHIWRWRDWIVESLNEDQPYNRMVLAMLAGDEWKPADRDMLRATGYLARNYYKFNRNTWLDATIEHTGKAFLGLTFNCARCHDHKYDPITHRDYYRLRAFFEPHQVRTDRVPGEPDTMQDGLPRAYDADLQKATHVFLRGNAKQPDEEHPVNPALPAALTDQTLDIEPVSLPPVAWYPGLRHFVQHDELAAAERQLVECNRKFKTAQRKLAESGTASTLAEAALEAAEKRRTASKAELASLKARIAADEARYADPPQDDADRLIQAAAEAERAADLKQAEAAVAEAEHALLKTRREAKQNDEKAKQAVEKAELALKAAKKKLTATQKRAKREDRSYSALTKTYPRRSSGRRLALARWIADDQNPLTARVAVNHIWMRHFGKPLVPTVFDFGTNGQAPTHPQLLDWLAVEFVKTGWSMKHLHKLIVSSAAYRMRSSGKGFATNREIDPDNRYLWRMNSRRMEAELVRDSVLHVAGRLNLKMGGPELDSEQGQTTYRRSIYYRHAPEKYMTFLKLFDNANANECYRRDRTVVPQQALALSNSRLSLEQARLLARELAQETGSGPKTDGAFINTAYGRILCRVPTEDERRVCREFLKNQTKRLLGQDGLTHYNAGNKVTVQAAGDPHMRARENLVHVLLNHNEFVMIR